MTDQPAPITGQSIVAAMLAAAAAMRDYATAYRRAAAIAKREGRS